MTSSCRHTGVAIPECSCRHCCERLIAAMQPDLVRPALVTPLAGRPVGAGPEQLAA